MSARDDLAAEYARIRGLTEALAAPLLPEDTVVQAADFASPPKWHLAHTTWFFEVFLLQAFLPAYRPVDEAYLYLFNSYYEAMGDRHPRPQRGHLSRPSLEDVRRYRHLVDGRMLEALQIVDPEEASDFVERTMLGLQHEQQHQELLLMDVKYNFSRNPLYPAYRPDLAFPAREASPLCFHEHPGGLVEIGHGGRGFAYDNETPRHRVHLEPFELANRPVTNGEFLTFIEDGGYRRPELWLSDGWAAISADRIEAPEYWRSDAGQRMEHTLRGLVPLDPAQPVAHVSYYEADAFARWAGARLPTETEWEAVAADLPVRGNFLEQDVLQPSASFDEVRWNAMFGDVWELTSSPYVPYPGYRPPSGALGEYNGKFMINQTVLRGGSAVTPGDHIRPTYRNFFYPGQRWCVQGFRLARDLL